MTDRWTDDPQVQDDPALEAFLRDLSAHADGSVDPSVRTATLEAMLAAETPATTRGWSWGGRIRRTLGLTGVKLVLAAGVAAATTTGGMAATGSLPAPMQEFAHDLGRQLGIGVPAAPGQLQQSDDDPDTTGRDYAPGQLKKSDGDPDTTGRDHAPGHSGDIGERPLDEQDVPVTSDEADKGPGDPDTERRDDTVPRDDAVRRDDTGSANRVEPDQVPPAGEAQDKTAQPNNHEPDRSANTHAPAEPAPPPEPEAPAGAADQPTPDPAQQPGRPDSASVDERQDSREDAPEDAPTHDNGRAAEHGR